MKNNIAKHQNKIEIIGIFVLICLFFYMVSKLFPTDYSLPAGLHNWLSYSSVKYVNEWLTNGLFKSSFYMQEAPLSIEYATYSTHYAYISYPIGSMLFIYFSALISGYSLITISFIRHFGEILLFMDYALLSYIIYLILTRFYKSNNIIVNIIIPISFSTVFLLYPNVQYFLKYVIFSDQIVIFWILLCSLLEIIRLTTVFKNKWIKYLFFAFYFLSIFMGTSTDYYFYIFIFILFIVNIVRLILCKTKIKAIIKESLLYVIPVLLSVGLFIIQIVNAENGIARILDKFFERTTVIDNIYDVLVLNFEEAYLSINKYLLITIVITLVVYIIYSFIKKEDNKKLFQILIVLIISPIIQILVLKQHSAIHNFSMIKLSIPLVIGSFMLIVIISKLSAKLYKKKDLFIFILIITSYAFLFFETRYISPVWYSQWVYDHYELINQENPNYELAEYLNESSEYNDVYFTFNHSIEAYDTSVSTYYQVMPQELAISQKQVYKVDTLKDIDKLFPNLPSVAVKYFVYDMTKPIDEVQTKEIADIKEKYKLVTTINGVEIYKIN